MTKPISYQPPITRTPKQAPVFVSYRDWAEFLTAAGKVRAGSRRSHYGDQSWCAGIASYDEALSLAAHGWAAGMEHVRQIALPALAELVSTKTQTAGWGWDVTGADYDVGEYLSGAPECWLAPVVEESKPVVKIVVNLTTSGGVSSDAITMRGAGVVALTMALQAAGYVVDVAGIVGTCPDYKQSHWQRIPLTDANGGPLDADRLIFALAHPASPRVLGYGVAKDTVLNGADWSRGGWAQEAPPWDADLYLPHTFLDAANWQDYASVSAWVKRTFEQLTTNQRENGS